MGYNYKEQSFQVVASYVTYIGEVLTSQNSKEH